MRGQQINNVSGKVLIVLSLTALLAVLSGYTQPPQPDEGAAAHIFQLSIVALVPIILLFFVRRIGGSLCEAHDHWHFQPPPWLWLSEPSTISSTSDRP